MEYRVLADLVLAVHAGFVAFVVVGLVVILVGGIRRWHWVHNGWFRIAHLLAILAVVAQAWLGVSCPLTILENHLREQAGAATYAGGFVAYWVRRALFYDAEPWVFIVCYTVFGALVVASWFLVRPRQRSR